MRIREDPIYLSSEVYRALWLLAKADKTKQGEREEPNALSSPDAIADIMLRQMIREQHPQIFEHFQQVEKLDKELIKTL